MDDSQQAVQITLRGMSLTHQTISKSMNAFLHSQSRTTQKTGKQTINELRQQNKALENVPIEKEDIKSLQKELKKYNVDFHIFRNKDSSYELLFKAEDSSQIVSAFEKVLKNNVAITSEKKKGSILEKIEQAKQKAAKRNVQGIAQSKTVGVKL